MQRNSRDTECQEIMLEDLAKRRAELMPSKLVKFYLKMLNRKPIPSRVIHPGVKRK